MSTNMIAICILAIFLLSLQLAFASAASRVLQPAVKMMLRLCMPPFLYRFMMQ